MVCSHDRADVHVGQVVAAKNENLLLPRKELGNAL